MAPHRLVVIAFTLVRDVFMDVCFCATVYVCVYNVCLKVTDSIYPLFVIIS